MSNDGSELMIVVGRGHSGTRVLAHTLYASGVMMGSKINPAGDNVPAQPMYDACLLFGPHVEWQGGLSWSFDRVQTMELDPEFEGLVRTYLKWVLASKRPLKGWKLPETTLVYPWIVRMFPRAKYVHIVRDPRDCLLGQHTTDDLARCKIGYPPTDDILAQRVASWKYQREIVERTPHPERFLSVRFEDLVLDQEATLLRLEEFLGIPLVRVIVDETRVGLWKSDPRLLPYVEPIAAEMRELGYD